MGWTIYELFWRNAYQYLRKFSRDYPLWWTLVRAWHGGSWFPGPSAAAAASVRRADLPSDWCSLSQPRTGTAWCETPAQRQCHGTHSWHTFTPAVQCASFSRKNFIYCMLYSVSYLLMDLILPYSFGVFWGTGIGGLMRSLTTAPFKETRNL